VIYVGLGLKGNGRVNEILGQGHAIHDFGATCNSPDSKKYSCQIPIEFKFTSRTKGCSIIGERNFYYILFNGSQKDSQSLLKMFQKIVNNLVMIDNFLFTVCIGTVNRTINSEYLCFKKKQEQMMSCFKFKVGEWF
jgi:hypothetical protein